MAQPQTTEMEVVQEFFAGLDEHDSELFDALVAEDVTTGIYRSGTDEDVTGAEGMRALWEEYWQAFPDLTGASTQFIHEDDRVAVFRTEEGTHEGEFRGIPATGESITFEYSGYLVVEDGSIVHAYFHGDMLDLLQQLGVDSPIPGATSD